MAHRMFVTKPRVGTVEGNRECVPHVGFQPVTTGDELFTREVVRVNECGVVSRCAFIVFGDLSIIDLDAVEPVPGLRARVGPNAGRCFHGFIEIGRARIGRDDRGVEVIRADFNKPVACGTYRFLGFAGMAQ